MITAFSRGHKIFYDRKVNVWKYLDDNSIINDSRPCKKCRRKPTKEGYDACIGYIKGASSVCCGHGKDEQAIRMRGEKCVNV